MATDEEFTVTETGYMGATSALAVMGLALVKLAMFAHL